MNKLRGECKRIEIKSTVTPINEINVDLNQFIKQYITEGYMDVWQYNLHFIGKIENGELLFHQENIFNPEFITEIRAFNNDCELLIWNSNGILKGRFRTDSEGKETSVIDATQVVVGTRKDDIGDVFCRVFEKSGREIILPNFGFDMAEGGNVRVALRTRNYIDLTSYGHATFNDVRFVSFEKYK